MKEKENNIRLRKKGISLIVLVITIIVIIILAAAVILTLTGNNPIENAKQATYINDLSSFQDELDMYKTNQYAINQGNFDPTILDAIGEDMYTYIPSMTGKIKYTAELEILDGRLIYTGSSDSPKKTWAAMANITDETTAITPKIPVTIGVNAPVLAAGMTAIKWNTTTNSWDNVSNPTTDTSWYSYTETDKQWANAKTADDSMWVWIPRYEYQIPVRSSTAQNIAVNFINGDSKTSTDGYTMHPAFTFGNDELTGIWVAKFEASGTISAVDIKPNVISKRILQIGTMFTASRNMETNSKYGWGITGNGIDTHLMKNIEWGAAAYLSSSEYGKIGEITINDNTSYLTGGGTYETNVSQSTTGNIYGIYDMNGGAFEYTAAYVNNGNSNLITYGNVLLSADNKYKDIYLSNVDTREDNYIDNLIKKGDAIYETSTSCTGSTSWYSDYSYMPYSNNVFFLRGGYLNSSAAAGLFSFHSNNGNTSSYYGFRPCLVII